MGSVRLGWPTSTIGVCGEWEGLKGAWPMGGKPEGGVAGSGRILKWAGFKGGRSHWLCWPMSTIGGWGQWEGLKGAWSKWVWPEGGGA